MQLAKYTTDCGWDPGGGVLPYIGYIGICGPKGYGLSAVLVDKLGIDFSHFAAILPPFLHSGLQFRFFLAALWLPLPRLTQAR